MDMAIVMGFRSLSLGGTFVLMWAQMFLLINYAGPGFMITGGVKFIDVWSYEGKRSRTTTWFGCVS